MTLNSEGMEKTWRFDIQYGPEGEANYAWVYAGKDLVATMRTHYAESVVEAMNRRALPPVDGLEVVAWLCKDLILRGSPTVITDIDHAWMRKAQPKAWAVDDLIRLSQASSVIAELEEERDALRKGLDQEGANHWKQRDRAETAEARISSLEEENKRLREALEPFAAVAEHDIGDDETDDDIFWPISNARYSMSARLRVGHLRAARQALGDRNG